MDNLDWLIESARGCESSMLALDLFAERARAEYEFLSCLSDHLYEYEGFVYRKSDDSPACYKSDSHYRYISESVIKPITGDKKRCKAHRFIYFVANGKPCIMPTIIDHIDRVRKNNKPENLRPSNLSRNAQNRTRRKWGTVFKNNNRNNRYTARAPGDSHIGSYSTCFEAMVARMIAAADCGVIACMDGTVINTQEKPKPEARALPVLPLFENCQ